MRIFYSIGFSVSAGCVFFLAACGSAPETQEVLHNPLVTEAHVDVPLGDDKQIYDALRVRVVEYERIRREARATGIISGVIRGTLLGVVTGSEKGALVGAVLGGVIGAVAAEGVASGLIVEHQAFLLKRGSIEAVIAAAQNDTMAIEADVDLLRKYSFAVAAHPEEVGWIDAVQVRRRMADNDVANIVAAAEERSHNLLIVTETLAAIGENVELLRVEQERQAYLHVALLDVVPNISDASGGKQ